MAEEAKWYVVHTYSGHENKVKATIENSVKNRGMEDYIKQVIVPTEDVIETTKTGKEKVRQRKIYPSYVLIQMIITDESWYIVRNTQGVTGFIGSSGKGAKPIPLLPQEVDRILNSMGMSRVDISKDLTEGKKVKIIAGPFKDMMAKIDSVDLKEQKLTVLVDLFGQETSVEVDMQEVETM